MLEDLDGQKLKDQFKSNKNLRLATYGIGGLCVIIIGYFAYRQFIYNPANEKSKESYYTGLNYAVADSTDAAIEELNVQVKKYDGKVGGEVAQFVLARQYMAKGEYKKALEELKDVKVNDTYVSVMALGLQADCYSEMEKYAEAGELYLEAADMNENEMTTPIYLMKAGLCAEQLNNFEKAAEYYQRIKDNYLSFASQKSIDKYIARAKNKTVK